MKKVTFILLIILNCSCTEEDEKLSVDSEVFYGTSFGECTGYCITETRVTGLDVEVVAKMWFSEEDAQQAEGELTTEQRDGIIEGIDLAKFEALPETIGCPDCADGGSEWLELTIGNELKRVTFEYGDSINGIDDAIEILRAVTEELHPVYDN
ncbi:MAG: hypothetical protein RJQ14_10810 [Marinoscillum sp.]